MFYHIIMKNFKSNLKNYILFFVSNILAIAELFAFWGLNDVVKKAVKDGVTAATLKSDFVLAAGLITFITVFLMIFSMKYYMKLRIKDYTTFIVLGMKKKTSYLLLLVEYTVGCVFSLVFGILMGNGILYGAQTALHKLYPEFLKVTAPGWKIYRNTCGMSVANMTGVFLILLVWMVIYVFPRYLYCRAFSGGCVWRGIDSGRAEASKTVLSSAYFTDESIVQ